MSQQDASRFYTDLFTRTPSHSMRYPNRNESRRLASICAYLSDVAVSSPSPRPLRILDLGCGRGWLTHFASAYGCCEGLDPVQDVVESARRRFPQTRFYGGTAQDLLAHPDFSPYDVVVSSEVIEHIPNGEKDAFVRHIKELLASSGHVILTTPQGKFYRKWLPLDYPKQPVEDWLTERELQDLLERHGFNPLRHGRIYSEQPTMSLLHRLCASRQLSRALNALHLSWFHQGLQYAAALYQTWLFQIPNSLIPNSLPPYPTGGTK